MANAYITEYAGLARDVFNYHVAAGTEPAVDEQKVTFTTTTASSAFNEQTRFVMIHVDAIAHLAFGDDPTATTGAHRMAANETRFYGVNPGQKVAFVTGS